MTEFLRKSFINYRKLGLSCLFAVLSWFVYAHDFNDSPYNLQPKVVKCYPNPATSYVIFEFPSDIDKNYMLQIYSFTGRKMTEVPVSSSKLSLILTNDYFRGIYVFQLRDKTGRIIEAGKFQVIR